MIRWNPEYFRKALDEECAKIRACETEEELLQQAKASAYKIGQIVASPALVHTEEWDEEIYVDAAIGLLTTATGRDRLYRADIVKKCLEAGMDNFKDPNDRSNTDSYANAYTDSISMNRTGNRYQFILQSLFETPLSKIFSMADQRTLIFLVRYILANTTKVIDGYTCIIERDVAQQASLSQSTVCRSIQHLEGCSLLTKLKDRPSYKNGNPALYIMLADCVYTGKLEFIEKQEGLKECEK